MNSMPLGVNGSISDQKISVRVIATAVKSEVESEELTRGATAMRFRKATLKEKHDAASGLWLMWLVPSLLIYPILFVMCGYDHSFGHPPFGIWAFTAVWTLVGAALLKRTVTTKWRMSDATAPTAKLAE